MPSLSQREDEMGYWVGVGWQGKLMSKGLQYTRERAGMWGLLFSRSHIKGWYATGEPRGGEKRPAAAAGIRAL